MAILRWVDVGVEVGMEHRMLPNHGSGGSVVVGESVCVMLELLTFRLDDSTPESFDFGDRGLEFRGCVFIEPWLYLYAL